MFIVHTKVNVTSVQYLVCPPRASITA